MLCFKLQMKPAKTCFTYANCFERQSSNRRTNIMYEMKAFKWNWWSGKSAQLYCNPARPQEVDSGTASKKEISCEISGVLRRIGSCGTIAEFSIDCGVMRGTIILPNTADMPTQWWESDMMSSGIKSIEWFREEIAVYSGRLTVSSKWFGNREKLLLIKMLEQNILNTVDNTKSYFLNWIN